MIKTTQKPEPVPTKQKCDAQKVYLDGTGWLELTRKVLPHKPNMKTMIKIEFATRQKNSLLLWQGNYEERHYFALAIVNGFLEFRFSMGGQPVVIRSKARVNTRKPVKVTVTRAGGVGSVHVEGDQVVERRSTKTKNGKEDRLKVKRAPVYLGGAPPGANKHLPHPKLYRTGFKGCILRLEVENKKVVDDQSGLAGYGSEIDFTDPRLLRNHGPTVRCLDTCLA